MFDPELLDTHDYAIIDRLVVEDIPRDLPVLSLAPATLRNEAHLLPVLVPLRALSPAQRTELTNDHANACTAGRPPLFAVLLDSPAAPGRVRSHLASRLLVRLADGAEAVLRYYDPRVFAQLQWILGPAPLRALFGPIERWTFLLDGAWQTTPVQAAEKPVWFLDARTSARLERIGLINETLARLAQPLPDTRARLGEKIDRLLVQAHARHRFERDEDKMAFAMHALTVHPEFDRHPTVQALIRRLTTEGQTYTDAAALLDEADWQRIGTEMNTQGKLYS